MIYNFENFLNEGKYDYDISLISKKFINKLKSKFGKKFLFKLDYDPNDYNIIDVKFKVTPSETLGVNFEIDALSDIETINIKIIYNPKYFPASYNKLLYRLKNILRHEMTHVTQFDLEDRADILRPKETPSPIEIYSYGGDEYFFQPVEVEAWVNGFYKESKTRRMMFTEVIDEWLEENNRDFENPENIQNLRKIWIDDFIKRYGTKYL